MLRLDSESLVKKSANSSASLIGKIHLDFISYSLIVDGDAISVVPRAELTKLPQNQLMVFDSPPSHANNLVILSRLGFSPDKVSDRYVTVINLKGISSV